MFAHNYRWGNLKRVVTENATLVKFTQVVGNSSSSRKTPQLAI